MLGVRGGDAGMKPLLRRAGRLIPSAAVLAGLGWLGYRAWGFATAETRLSAVCQSLAPGMSMDELRDFAARHGLNAPRNPSGVGFMVESRTFGRYGSQLESANGRLVSAQYHFAD